MTEQRHGANIYRPDGSKSALLDFSNTVVELPPPHGWEARLAKELSSLRHYPQPYAAGLAHDIERGLRLPTGSVMLTNGSSEALACVAQSLKGKRVLVEAPCFGEYAVWLERAGALFREIGADEPWSPDWPRLSEALKDAEAFWTANPSNPSGLELSRTEFNERLAFCRKRKALFVLDEALAAQSLDGKGDTFLRACVKEPGALVVRSLSKGLGLPGLRLGYLVGHPREIAKLGKFQDLWSVSSLAQRAGHWMFSEERRLAAARTKMLALWKADLLSRLGKLSQHRLLMRQSDTGFFLCRLLGKLDNSQRLAARLKAKGVLIRSCASYGGWGSGYIRLNPRSPKDNARLEKAFKAVYAAF